MTSSQQFLLVGAMLVIQAVAMGLPYWMGRQAGRAIQDAMQETIDLLQRDLQEANERGLLRLTQSDPSNPIDIGGNHV